MRSGRTQSLLFAVVLTAAALAWALPFRPPNCNTGSHYALVQALASGNRTIDAIHGESCDISWWHGHFHANKAPGLALYSVPWYLLTRALGAHRDDSLASAAYPASMRALPRRDLWLMSLWGALLPALALLVLVRRAADRLQPGTGTAAAAALAFATLLLPFGGLFFSHALSALLVFAAFSVLWRANSAAGAAGAGAIAGLAVAVEYPNALFLVVLFILLCARPLRRLRVLAAYLAGSAFGLMPLLAFDRWAFGSAFHLSYVGAVMSPGASGHDVLGANTGGFFGVEVPSLARLVHLIVGDRGLLMTAPFLALAPFGIVRLWQRGERWIAGAIAAVSLAFLVYNAGYYSPIGGATPGPRFLIPALPFLVLAATPVVTALRARGLAIVVAGTVVLLAADVTQPLIGRGYTPLAWLRWIRSGSFSSTILDPAGHTWPGAAVVASAVVAGLVAGFSSVGRATLPFRRRAPRQAPARDSSVEMQVVRSSPGRTAVGPIIPTTDE